RGGRPRGGAMVGFGRPAAGVGLALSGYGLHKLSRPRTGEPSAAPTAVTHAGDLVDRVEGYVVFDEPVGGIDSIQLPSGQQSYVRAPGARAEAAPLSVTAVAGPDAA